MNNFYFTAPFEQFEIFNFYLFFVFVDNLFVFYFLLFFFFIILIHLNLLNTSIIPTNFQFLLESIYNFILSLFKEHVGNKNSLFLFPLVNSLFIFILLANFSGLVPYGFTVTGHVLLTFTLSFSIFNAITAYGFLNHKLNFFYLFVPSNVPKALLFFLIVIELMSYLIRPFSLSIRLFANMLAGHVLLNIISSFIFYLWNLSFLAALIPFFFLIAILGLEFAIAFIQAYVFTILTCIYIKDSYIVKH